jgi:hypothetical protein
MPIQVDAHQVRPRRDTRQLRGFDSLHARSPYAPPSSYMPTTEQTGVPNTLPLTEEILNLFHGLKFPGLHHGPALNKPGSSVVPHSNRVDDHKVRPRGFDNLHVRTQPIHVSSSHSEQFRKLLDKGTSGDNVGALLRGTERTDIERGQVLSKPGTITPHTQFKAETYKLRSRTDSGRLDDLL